MATYKNFIVTMNYFLTNSFWRALLEKEIQMLMILGLEATFTCMPSATQSQFYLGVDREGFVTSRDVPNSLVFGL